MIPTIDDTIFNFFKFDSLVLKPEAPWINSGEDRINFTGEIQETEYEEDGYEDSESDRKMPVIRYTSGDLDTPVLTNRSKSVPHR